MTDLTDFLLARIREDEAATWTLRSYICAPGHCAPEGWVGSQCRYCDPVPVYGGTVAAMTEMAEEHAEQIHQRSRVLAECEAKRRILDLHARSHECSTYQDDSDEPNEATWVSAGRTCSTLRLLALPFADQPDYRDEWKP